MQNELKPCPFCGGKANIIIVDEIEEGDEIRRAYTVACRKCSVSIGISFSKNQVIEVWNRRVAD